ncbi:hypothetical protein BGZ54_001413 [Gamsiella multidivaricata]|nr:hypothetical protein BGZ54_001413 [Gamsiella multidivaricata]
MDLNNTFVNTTELFVANGTFTRAPDFEYHRNLSGFKFMMDMVTTPFNTDLGENGGFNNTCYNTNINIIPLYPTGITSPSGIVAWAALIDNNGTAILETGMVGYRSMREGPSGYTAALAKSCFPTVIPGFAISKLKVVKSYYRINSDPRKWRERTVLLGKNIMSNVDADPIPGSSISRPPLNFTAGDTPVSIDSMMLAHLLFLAGSPDVELVGSYTIGRIFSTTSISIWLVVAILLPASLYIAVHCWFKDLERAMGHSWNCVMSSAMHGRCYQGPPLKIMLRAYSDDDVDVMMGDSVLRAINDDESSRDLVRLESIKDDD